MLRFNPFAGEETTATAVPTTHRTLWGSKIPYLAIAGERFSQGFDVDFRREGCTRKLFRSASLVVDAYFLKQVSSHWNRWEGCRITSSVYTSSVYGTSAALQQHAIDLTPFDVFLHFARLADT